MVGLAGSPTTTRMEELAADHEPGGRRPVTAGRATSVDTVTNVDERIGRASDRRPSRRRSDTEHIVLHRRRPEGLGCHRTPLRVPRGHGPSHGLEPITSRSSAGDLRRRPQAPPGSKRVARRCTRCPTAIFAVQRRAWRLSALDRRRGPKGSASRPTCRWSASTTPSLAAMPQPHRAHQRSTSRARVLGSTRRRSAVVRAHRRRATSTRRCPPRRRTDTRRPRHHQPSHPHPREANQQ